MRALPERPALSPWFRVLHDVDRLLLEHGGTVIAFDGKAAGLLLPSLLSLLDGRRTVEEIVDTLGEPIAPATRNALALLNENGALLDGPQPTLDGAPATEAAIFTAPIGGATVAETLAALVGRRVAISGTSPTAVGVAHVLRDAGLETVRKIELDEASDGSELLIAVPGPGELESLTSTNERRLELRAPWIQILPNDGHIVSIGPLYVPDVTGCHTCYRLRLGACSGFEDDFERIAGAPPRAGSPAPLTAVVAGIAGILALRWLALGDPTLPGRFYTLRTTGVLGLDHHRLLRVPRCPTCGAGDAPMPSPWFDEKAHGH